MIEIGGGISIGPGIAIGGTPPPIVPIITEDGLFMITESGEQIIEE